MQVIVTTDMVGTVWPTAGGKSVGQIEKQENNKKREEREEERDVKDSCNSSQSTQDILWD